MRLREIRWEDVDCFVWFNVVTISGIFVNTIMNLLVP
jgi:hypothetical protein